MKVMSRMAFLLSFLSAAAVTVASKRMSSTDFEANAAVVFLATDTKVLSLNTTSGAQTVLTQSEARIASQYTCLLQLSAIYSYASIQA